MGRSSTGAGGAIGAGLAFAIALAANAGAAFAQSAVDLGHFPVAGYESIVYALSADGTTPVGMSPSADLAAGEAFRWDLGVLTPLGFTAPDLAASIASDVSADGLAVAGYNLFDDGTDTWTEGFFWAKGGIRVGLGCLDGTSVVACGPDFSTLPNAISADGTVIVGTATMPGITEAFRRAGNDLTALLPVGSYANSDALAVSGDGSLTVGWSFTDPDTGVATMWAAGGAGQSLGMLDDGTVIQFSVANAISADGTIVVGQSVNADGGEPWLEAFKWDSTNGMVALGYLDDGFRESLASGISSDGSTIFGTSANSSGTYDFIQAVVWEGGAPIAALPTLSPIADLFAATNPPNLVNQVNAASADGSVLVGWSLENENGENVQEAARWTGGQVESIRAILDAAGTDLTGWQLTEAVGVSADGETIVGNGTDPNGASEAWIFRNDAILTLDAAGRSFYSLTALPQRELNALDAGLLGQFEIADQQCRPARDGAPRPVCLFGSGFVGDGSILSGTLGLAFDLGGGAMAGVSVTTGRTDAALPYGSSYDRDAVGGAAYLSYLPETGPQFVAAASADSLSFDVTRIYTSGNTPFASHGSADGSGYGGAVRLGWRAAVDDRLRAGPFASYSAAHVSTGDITETDGPFPAVIDGFSQTSQIGRLGAEGRYHLTPASWLFGSLNWAHQFDDTTSTASGTLIGLFDLSVTGAAASRDWAEATVGVRHAVGAGAFAASLSLDTANDGTNVGGRVSFSRPF